MTNPFIDMNTDHDCTACDSFGCRFCMPPAPDPTPGFQEEIRANQHKDRLRNERRRLEGKRQ